MADNKEEIIIASLGVDASGIQQSIKETKAGLQDLNNVPLDKPFRSFKAEIRAATEEAYKLRTEFGAGSKEFVNAKVKISDLKKEFQLFNESVAAFNPENKLQALINVGKGASHAFEGYTGAMTLLGEESADTEKQIEKLQALMALSEGLAGLNEARESFKNFGEVIKASTAFQEANNVATAIAGTIQKAFSGSVDTTSTSFKFLKGAIAATGIGLLVVGIGELVSHFDDLKEALGFANEEQKQINKTLEDYSKGAAKAIEQVNLVKEGFELAEKGVISKKEALQKYNDTLGDSLGKVNSLQAAEDMVAKKAQAYIQITGLKAQANALFALSAEQSSKALLATQDDQTDFIDKSKTFLAEYIGGSGAGIGIAIDAQQKGVEKAVKKANESAEILQKKGEELLQKAAELGKANKIDADVLDNKDHSKDDNKAAEEAKRLAALYKEEQEKLRQHYLEMQKIIDDAHAAQYEANLDERHKELAQLDDHFNEEDSSLQKNYDEQKKILDAELARKAISRAQYNQKVLSLDIITSDAVLAIQEEKSAKSVEVEKKYSKIISDFIDGYQENAYQKSRQKLIDDFDEKIKVADDKQKEILEKLKTQEVDKVDNQETLRKNTINTETTVVNVQANNEIAPEDSLDTKLEKQQAEYEAVRDQKSAQFDEEYAKLGDDEDAKANLLAKYNKQVTDDDKANTEARKNLRKAEVEAQLNAASLISNTLNQAADLAGKHTAAGKVLAVAAATIDTYKSAVSSYAGMVQAIPGPYGIAAGFIAAAVSVAAGIANVKKILSVKVPSKGGGDAGQAPPAYTAPTINSTALDPSLTATKDVRVVNPQDQVVKAYISDRDMQANTDKKAFYDKLGSF